jgi:thiamine-phosphate pyrophosphorylase
MRVNCLSCNQRPSCIKISIHLIENLRHQAKRVPHGLYAITDPGLTPPASIVDKAKLAILGGACMIQYRDKTADWVVRQRQAMALARLCNNYRIPLIINDDARLARSVGARGVHLGMNDMTIAEARSILGDAAIIGASCYNDFARAENAWRGGADYVAFGSFYPSLTKPQTITADLELLRHARRILGIPVCAIGGITAENAALLIRAGATLVAVISGVFAQPDPRTAARNITRCFAAEVCRT